MFGPLALSALNSRPIGALPLTALTDEELVTRFEALEAQQAKAELHFFVQKTWHLVEPKKPFVDNWHIQRICRELEKVTRGEIKRLILNIPPGTLKSLLLVFWRAWEWASNPELRYLTASYSPDLTIRDNLRVRQIITSKWYQKYFTNVQLKGDQNAKERFDTTATGWCIATSVGGPGTGEHPDRVIIDDPINAKQARQEARVVANNWFDDTIAPRGIARDVAVIICMQRLHREDLTGYVQAKNPGAWVLVKLPMRYEPFREKTDQDQGNFPDPEDPRTEAGELLIPQLIDEEKVRTLEIDLGPYGTAGQLQQRPSPEGGGLFKREHVLYVEAAPQLARRVRCWDTAATDASLLPPAGKQKKSDWTAGVRISEPPGIVDSETGIQKGLGIFYIEHIHHVKYGPAAVDKLMEDTAKDDGVGVSIRELQEPAASGKTVIAARTKSLVGYDHKGVTVTGDKVTMAKPLRAQWEAGNVRIVRTGDPMVDKWIEPFLAEIEEFPMAEHDDQVDAATNGFNAVLLEPFPSPQWITF